MRRSSSARNPGRASSGRGAARRHVVPAARLSVGAHPWLRRGASQQAPGACACSSASSSRRLGKGSGPPARRRPSRSTAERGGSFGTGRSRILTLHRSATHLRSHSRHFGMARVAHGLGFQATLHRRGWLKILGKYKATRLYGYPAVTRAVCAALDQLESFGVLTYLEADITWLRANRHTLSCLKRSLHFPRSSTRWCAPPPMSLGDLDDLLLLLISRHRAAGLSNEIGRVALSHLHKRPV